MFTDSDSLVRGRYYFAESDRPALRFFHMYGSRVWDQRPNEAPPPFGESRTATHVWNPGQLPVDVPEAIFTGSPGCAAVPHSVADAIPMLETFDGFPPKCFGIPASLLKFFTYTSYMRCTCQLLWAWVICELYDDATANITALLVKLLGDVNIVYHPRLDPLPRFALIWTENWWLVAVEGTTTYQQGALEGLYSPLGPQDQGGYSTHGLWQAGANRITQELSAQGYVAGTPIFLCGHSLGGCCALVAAAMLREGSPDSLIRYLTFGAPAIGDGRIVRLLDSCEGACIDNVGDIFTAVPAGLAELGPVVALVTLPFILLLERWQSAPFHWRQYADGRFLPGRQHIQISSVLIEIYVDIATGVIIQPIDPHRIATYIERIRRRCPGPSWPIVDSADYATLTSCTPAAFGWLNLGGVIGAVPLAGAIALGGDIPNDCTTAIPIPFERLIRVFLIEDAIAWAAFFPAATDTYFVTWGPVIGGLTTNFVFSGPCSSLGFLGFLSPAPSVFFSASAAATGFRFELGAGVGVPVMGTIWVSTNAVVGPSAASGELALGGEIPGDDGTTCAKAILKALGDVISGGASPTAVWYKIPVTVGTIYIADFECLTGLLNWSWYYGNDCATKTLIGTEGVLNGTNTASNKDNIGSWWYIQITIANAAWQIVGHT